MRGRYFGVFSGLTEVLNTVWSHHHQHHHHHLSITNQEEMRLSPLLNQHASGVVLGITQIINGLDNPVTTLSNYHHCHPQLVVKEVAFKFATSHFDRGVNVSIKQQFSSQAFTLRYVRKVFGF